MLPVLEEMEREGIVERIDGDLWAVTEDAMAVADAVARGLDPDAWRGYKDPTRRPGRERD